MIICNILNVSKKHAANVVLAGVSLEVKNDSRIGLVGPNGAGKSTLLRLVAGVDSPGEGLIERKRGLRIGYLPQAPVFTPGATVLDEALKAREYLDGLEARMKRLEERMSLPEVYDDEGLLQQTVEEYESALRQFQESGGENVDGRVLSLLKDLGFTDDDLLLPVDALSGGQEKLLYLARVLTAEPELVLLDEPDNHLDVAGKEMLERLIVNYAGAVLVVSHDRHLLDVVIETTAELEVAGQHPGRPQLSSFPGNYSEFAAEKRLALLQQQKNFELQQLEIRRLVSSAKRLLGWSNGQNEKFVRRAKSILKRVERIDRIERPILQSKRIGVELRTERGGFKVIELRGVTKQFGDSPVLCGIDLLVTHGERVAIVGPNGAGKSVLFKVMLGQELPTTGDVKLGARINPGYYAQQQETLDWSCTAVEEIRGVRDMHESDAFAFLGRFLFDARKASRRVGTLSGGEKARLQIAKLVLVGGNLLLLDEPTNNLDIASCEALEEALDVYEGTIIVISHDRYFLDRLAARRLNLVGGRLVEEVAAV